MWFWIGFAVGFVVAAVLAGFAMAAIAREMENDY